MPEEEKPTNDKKKEKPWRSNESQMITVQLEEEPAKKDKITRKDVWKPDETQMVRIQEALTPRSFEKPEKKEKAKDEETSE